MQQSIPAKLPAENKEGAHCLQNKTALQCI